MLLKKLYITLLLLFSISGHAGEVRIAVASNFVVPIKSIVHAFETNTNTRVSVSIASSGKHYAQILNGAPYDIFLSADQIKPAGLVQKQLALPETIFTYAIGKLVLVSNNTMEPMAALTQGQYKRLAIANPKLAPYGKAAVEILSNMDLLQESRAKWVVGENIAQAFQFFSSGNADLGFVAKSQILSSTQYSNQKFWIVPENLYTPINQDAVLLRKAQRNAAALSFYEFLKSKEAQSIIQEYGYDVPPILEGLVE